MRVYDIEYEVSRASPGVNENIWVPGPAGSMVTSNTVGSNHLPPMSEMTERLGYSEGRGSAPEQNPGSGSTEKYHCITAGKETERRNTQGTRDPLTRGLDVRTPSSSSVTFARQGIRQEADRGTTRAGEAPSQLPWALQPPQPHAKPTSTLSVASKERDTFRLFLFSQREIFKSLLRARCTKNMIQ